MLVTSGDQPEISWDGTLAWIREEFPTAKHISPQQLYDRVEAGDSVVLIDAREAHEFAISHLPEARRALTLEEAKKVLPEALGEEVAIIVYCSVGYRSSRLAVELQEAGYENVFNLEGSIFRWANEGMPLECDGKPVTGVHPFNPEWGKLLKESLWQGLEASE